ncbi:MAG: CHAT domain-containing protein [Planctomycetota bacterium]
MELLTKGAATESRVRQQVGRAHFVHFCTHGFAVPLMNDSVAEAPTADESLTVVAGIALVGGARGLRGEGVPANDGVLFTHEMADLDLARADLVTLSSCQSALGEPEPGEGMLSAQRAINIAGARASLTAIWSVDDESTRDLMNRFYDRLWRRRQSKAAALQGAMVDMLRLSERRPTGSEDGERLRTPPSLWSGFVLHGDWR